MLQKKKSTAKRETPIETSATPPKEKLPVSNFDFSSIIPQRGGLTLIIIFVLLASLGLVGLVVRRANAPPLIADLPRLPDPQESFFAKES